MFSRLTDDAAASVEFEFDGQTLKARAGDSVAAALLSNGISLFRRTPISSAARGPYCLMGVCFECLVEIDSVGNQQACMTEVRPGMKVSVQDGRKALT